MSEQPKDVDGEWPVLADDCLVYRAVLKRRHIDKNSNQILSGAFLRRPPGEDGTPKDVNGLSVMLAEQWPVSKICSRFNLHAVCSLSVAQIRTVPDVDPRLDVVQQTLHDYETGHANITGLPAYGEDAIKADNLAVELSIRCRPEYFKP